MTHDPSGLTGGGTFGSGPYGMHRIQPADLRNAEIRARMQASDLGLHVDEDGDMGAIREAISLVQSAPSHLRASVVCALNNGEVWTARAILDRDQS